MSLEHIPLQLSRHAFGPRDAARAGDVWRLFQDAAVIGSSRRGWPPPRYRSEGCAFVVRTMTVLHDRETHFGEAITAKTWVSSFRRETFSQRQVELHAEGSRIARASQKWVHVALPKLAPCRAQPALVEAFEVVEPEPVLALPPIAAVAEGPAHTLQFETWHTTMDPLAHANHPAYVDWADEAVCRAVAQGGADPQSIVPVAGTLTWRSGVIAPESVRVQVTWVGTTADGACVLDVDVRGGDGRGCCTGRIVRTSSDVGALQAAISRPSDRRSSDRRSSDRRP